MPSLSKEEIIRARQADIVTYLESVNEKARLEGKPEPYPMQRDTKTSGEIRVSGYGGLLVKDNYWSVQSRKEMKNDKLVTLGGNTLDFLIKFEGKSFLEAVNLLNGKEFKEKSAARPARQYVPKGDKSDFVPPERFENSRRAISYLTKTRKIDVQIVIDQIKKGNLYEEQKYHNAIFIGRSPDGQARWANKRSTLTDKTFKGDQKSSDPRYPFVIRNDKNREDRYLIVTESPIEAMSYATLLKIQGMDPYKNDIMGTGGAHGVGLLQYLKDHPQTRGVILALNNDRQGIESSELIKNQLKEHGYLDRKDFALRIIFPRGTKDWNEFLDHTIQRVEAQKRLNEERGVVGEISISMNPNDGPQKFLISKNKIVRNGTEVVVLYGEKNIATLNPVTKTFGISERGNQLKDTYFVKGIQINPKIKEQILEIVNKAIEAEKIPKRLTNKELLQANPKDLSPEDAMRAYALKKQYAKKQQQTMQQKDRNPVRDRVPLR